MSSEAPSFKDIIKQLFADITQTNGLIVTFFMLGVLTTIVSILMSIYYVYSMMDIILKGMMVTTPLNIDTLEYNTMMSTRFFVLSKFNMWLFMVFPLLTLLSFLIMGIFVIIKNIALPTLFKYTAWIFVAHNFLIFIGYSLFFFRARYQHGVVSSRILGFNQYVCQRIYRNTKFLNFLKTPQTDMVSIVNIFTDSMLKIPINSNKNDLAKAFYTLTLYYHYHKIGVRNPKIMGALSLFNPTMLLIKSCQPADYLNRYGTYIEDISELIKHYLPVYLNPSTNPNTIPALDLAYNWTLQTNNYANSLYPEDALRPFVLLTSINLTLQTISAVILSYFIADGERFRSLVSKVTHASEALLYGVAI